MAALDAHAPGWVSQPLDPADMGAYWAAMRDWWAHPGSLVVVEHDMVPSPGFVEGFAGCPQPWCGHPYNAAGTLLVALGCTRFAAELKTAEPDLLDVVALVDTDGLPARDWRRLDVRMGMELRRRGYTAPHWHEPAAEHLHVYP